MKELDEMEGLFLSRHQLVRVQNNALELLRNMSLSKILKMMNETIKSDLLDIREYRKDIIKGGVSEIVARSSINRIIQKCLECSSDIVCEIKYRNIISVIRKVERKYKSESNGCEKVDKDNWSA